MMNGTYEFVAPTSSGITLIFDYTIVGIVVYMFSVWRSFAVFVGVVVAFFCNV